MDFNLPRSTLPEPNLWLSPYNQQFDQWTRLTIGSSISLTVFAPLLRAVTLNMAQREHRRQGRFVPPLKGPFLPFASITDAIKQVWSLEGWRGYFRGMGALYIAMPIRSAYHIVLFDHIEPNDSHSIISSRIKKDFQDEIISIDERTPEKDKKKSQNQIVAEALNTNHSLFHSSQSSTQSTEMSQSSYLLRAFGIIVTGELFLYPARWAFTRLSGDLLSTKKTILSNRSTYLLLHTIQKEGLFAVYRGFIPCLIAVAIPALTFANSRFTSRRKAYRDQIMANQIDSHPQEGKIVSRANMPSEADSASRSITNFLQNSKNSGQTESKFSTAWIVMMILVYPVICIHTRMVIGNQIRVPRGRVMAKSSPILRQLVARLFPSYSTSANAAFLPTYQRVLEGGPESAYTTFAQVLGLRFLFEFSADLFAAFAAWPLNLYVNNLLYGILSLDSPQRLEKELNEAESIEKERQEMLKHVLELRDHPPDSLQSSPKLMVSEKDPRRYEMNDSSLEALGLNPIVPAKSRTSSRFNNSTTSHDPNRPKSRAELLDETPLSALASEGPLARLSPLDDILAYENHIKSPDQGKSQPSSSGDATNAQKRPVPLLSQELPWYSSNRRDSPSKPL